VLTAVDPGRSYAPPRRVFCDNADVDILYVSVVAVPDGESTT